MTVRIAQFVHPTSDVVDQAFLRDFPECHETRPRRAPSVFLCSSGALARDFELRRLNTKDMKRTRRAD